MVALVDPYDDVNAIVTWEGREASPWTRPAEMLPQTEDAAWAGAATETKAIAVAVVISPIVRRRPP